MDQVLGFDTWCKINEASSLKDLAVYTKFEIGRLDLAYYSYLEIKPNSNILHQALEKIDETANEYLPGFIFEKLPNSISRYLVYLEHSKEDTLELDFDEIEFKDIIKDWPVRGILNKIKSESVETIKESRGMLEVILKEELNLLPQESVLPKILEEYFKESKMSLEPKSFESELESILLSQSVGGSFFNKDEVKNFMSRFLSHIAVQVYSSHLIERITVERETLDLTEIDRSFEAKTKEILFQLSKPILNDDSALEIIKFIKKLLVFFRPKGGKIKTAADSALSRIMTKLEESDHFTKVFDLLK